MNKYLHLTEQISAINRQFSIKSYEIELLDVITKSHMKNQPIFVSDLIHNKSIASSATLHVALKSLTKKGLIAAKQDKHDGRKRAISLTKLAVSRYKQLNSLLSK